MRIRNAFTMLELIFVIVIMGIIGKYGTEFLMQSYNSFIYSKINNTLQSDSEITLEFIASRLQYRIKDSVIARTDKTTAFTALANASGETFKVLEWVSADIENFRGTTKPNWSGIIDIDHTNATANVLVSPDTNTSAINVTINTLSHERSTIDDAALFFIGANTDINGYGWDGNALTDQTDVMHPINDIAGNLTQFAPAVGNFTGIDVYEYYKLAWTANAIMMEDFNNTTKMGNLEFYFNYQPWNGDKFYDNNPKIKHFTLMENVSTFQAMALGSIIKIQVCTKSMIVNGVDEDDDNDTQGGYSLCKEKTIF